ncbi:hypothetical protein C1645_839382 [Glomus cerebriforme]|uniref:Uncharacterized protein n=1 Tax=Glomus cerebriforme TaxID=658196 RepID=A0A397SCF3_9GLOM|nr:hypothetical protein C1645_839382 [Glomus cerebriforme]
MSNKIKDANFYIDWLEKSITNEYFNYYEYSGFKNIESIEVIKLQKRVDVHEYIYDFVELRK